MSSQRNSDNRFANRNVNTAYPRTNSGPGAQAAAPRYGQGLVSLGSAPRRSRSGGQPAPKVSVPRPVNLPSLKKENAGNDPATQLVPAGGAGGWQRPGSEEEAAAQAAAGAGFETAGSALTAGSNWGSAPARQGFAAGWTPAGGEEVAAAYAARPPPPARGAPGRAPPGPPRDRRLNATEFPSLAAASLPVQPKPPVPQIPLSSQRAHNWDEDERQLPSAAAISSTGPAGWEAGGKADDDEELFPAGSHGSQQDWASRKPQPEWQGPTAVDWQAPVGAGDEAPALLGLAPPEARADVPAATAQPPVPRSMPPRPPVREEPSWRAPRADYMNGSLGTIRAGPLEAHGPSGARAHAHDMVDFPPLADEAATLFPPPPPPAGPLHHPPPPPPRKQEGLDASVEVGKLGTADEREAFVSELDRITAELEQEKERNAAEKRRLEAEARQAEAELERQQAPPPPEVPPPPPISARAALGFPDHQQDPFGSEPDSAPSEQPPLSNGPLLEDERPQEARKGRKMNFRPLDVEDEEERKRKERAAAKLAEIEERIARRQLEEQRLKEEADAARAAADAAALASQELDQQEAAEEAAARSTPASLQVVDEDRELAAAAIEAEVTAVAADFAAKIVDATGTSDAGSYINSSLAVEIGSDVGSGSIDGQGDHGTDSSILDAISSLKAVSDISEVQAEAELIAPASLEASAGPVAQTADLRSAPGQGTSQPPAELLFGTASGILAPSATLQPPASPSTLPSPSVKIPTPVPVKSTPGVPTPTPPAQPLPIANAWRKPLQGTSAVDKAAADVPPAQDAQAPRAAAEAATVDQASVAAVTGAVPADSGRAGRGRGRGSRGRDREPLSSDNIERPGEAAGGRGGRVTERGRGRGSRRGSRGAVDALEPHGPSPPPQAPFGDGGLMGDPQMRGRRPRGRGPHQPQPSPPGSATPNAPSREGSTPRDPGQSPRDPPQMPVQGQRGRGGRGGRGPAGGILQRGRNQNQGQGQGGSPPTASALPLSAPAPTSEAPAAAADPAGATAAAELQAPPGILTQAKATGLQSKERVTKGASTVGLGGLVPTDPVQQGRRVQAAPGGSPTSGGGFSPVLDPVAPPTPSGDGPGASGRTDRVIDWPKSQGLAVSRPKSASAAEQAVLEVLPNGIPPLPADLSFDQPPQPTINQGPMGQGHPQQGPPERRDSMGLSSVHPNPPPHIGQAYGFTVPASQTGFIPAGAFPGVMFPMTPGGHAGMWQMAPGPPGQPPGPPHQPNFEAAVQSFFAAGQGPHPRQMQQDKHAMHQQHQQAAQNRGFPTSNGPTHDPNMDRSNQPPSNPLPQFGTFGNFGGNPFPQFGNLGSAFQQSPFVPTGKQPDWSTGPSMGAVAGGGGRGGDPNASRQPPSSFIRKRDGPPHDAQMGPHQGGGFPRPPPRNDRPHPGPPGPPGSRMHNGPHMNGTAPGPPMPDLDRLVPGMDSPGLGMPQGPPGPPVRGPPPSGVQGLALPDDLTGSDDLNSSSTNRQQARLPKGMMQGRGRSDQNRRPSTGGRGGPARGTGPPSSSSNNSINAGRSSGRGGGRPGSSRGPAPPQAPPPDTAPPPGLPGPPRLGPLPEATQQASTAIANGPSTSSGEARNVRQGRPSQEGPARGSKQPGGRGTRAHQSGPGRGRGAGGNMPRTASDKAGIPPAHAAGEPVSAQ